MQRTGLGIVLFVALAVGVAGCASTRVRTEPPTTGQNPTVTSPSDPNTADIAATSVAVAVAGVSVTNTSLAADESTTAAAVSSLATTTVSTLGTTSALATATTEPATTTTPTPRQAQTITAGTPAAGWQYGNSITVGATASSGLPVAVGASGVCAVVNAATFTVKATDVGTCTLRYTQVGDDRWLAASAVTRTVQTVKATPTISGFANQTVEMAVPYSAFALTLKGTATAGAPIVYRSETPVDPTAGGWTCVVTGNVLTLGGFGNVPQICVVSASVEASAMFNAAKTTASIKIDTTVVKIVSHTKAVVTGNAASLSITTNRAWTLRVFDACAVATFSPPGDAVTHTLKLTVTRPCSVTVQTDAPNLLVTTDSFTLDFP
jgi:hypothetical protein